MTNLLLIVPALIQFGMAPEQGKEHTKQALGWAVLAHNLWVLARREMSMRKAAKRRKVA